MRSPGARRSAAPRGGRDAGADVARHVPAVDAARAALADALPRRGSRARRRRCVVVQPDRPHDGAAPLGGRRDRAGGRARGVRPRIRRLRQLVVQRRVRGLARAGRDRHPARVARRGATAARGRHPGRRVDHRRSWRRCRGSRCRTARRGHLVVLAGETLRGDPIVYDPAAADAAEVRRTYPRAAFERAWLGGSSGTVYLVRPPDVPLPAGSGAW